jgi:hypothetical protein
MDNDQKFMVLTPPSPPTVNAVYAVISSGDDGPAYVTTRCQVCGRHTSKKQVRNLTIELYGAEVVDIIWSDGDEVFVSRTVGEVLMNCRLRGLNFREAYLAAWWAVDASTNEMVDFSHIYSPPQIFQLVITGRGGSIHPKTKTTHESQCATCGTKVYKPLRHGFRVDPEQWDGSDLFVMDEFPGYILMTEAAISCLKINSIRNMAIIDADKFSML